MIRVCPNPMPWMSVHERLKEHARITGAAEPPHPLILGGWNYTNDLEKQKRWSETLEWAQANGCTEATVLDNDDYYFVETVTTYDIGPMGGPMLREWDFETKKLSGMAGSKIAVNHGQSGFRRNGVDCDEYAKTSLQI